MSDCGDEHLIAANAVKKREWIAREYVAMFAMATDWPPLGRFTNGHNCVLDFKQKPLSRHLATLPVPRFVLEQLLLSFEVKPNRLHPRR